MSSRATFFAILRVRPDNVANLHCKLSLLRARRERPGGRRAAEQRGELAPFHQQFLPCFEAEDSTAGDLLHCGISKGRLSAMGHDRSLADVASMSGLPPKCMDPPCVARENGEPGVRSCTNVS